MSNTVIINTDAQSRPLSYKAWAKRVSGAYITEEQSLIDYSEYVTGWHSLNAGTKTTHKSDVKEMYISLLKDITLNYTTVEEKRFLLNIDYTNPRDLDVIIPFYTRKLRQIAKYYTGKREEVINSGIKNTIKGSDLGVEVSIKNYVLGLLSDDSFTTQFNVIKPKISVIGKKIVVETEELYETQQVEYDLDPVSLEKTNGITSHVSLHNHTYEVDGKGNGWAHYATHAEAPQIKHKHKVVNWILQPSQSSCFPNCADKYDYQGVGLHTHELIIPDTNIHRAANLEDIDPLLFLDIAQVVANDLKNCDIALGTQECIDPSRARISQSDNVIGVNIDRSDWAQLPLSSFVGGEKTYDNLIYHQQKSLIKKYMGTTFYYLSTGSTAMDYVSGVLFTPDNPHRNILNRYYPGHLSISPNPEYKTSKQLGGFFTPNKMGMLTFASYAPSYKIDTNLLSPNSIYSFPDPAIYGAGRGLSTADQASPIVHSENVEWVKYDKSNHYAAGDPIDDEILPKFNAYQSREESTNSHPSGLSRRSDKVDFWTGGIQHIWTNEDVYPIKPLHPLPIEERLGDLLISDLVIQTWRTDMFGNEFGLYKPSHSKRVTSKQKSGDLIIDRPDTVTTIATMANDWFDIPRTSFYGTNVIMTGNYLLSQFNRFSIIGGNYNYYIDASFIPTNDDAAQWVLDTDGNVFNLPNSNPTGLVSTKSSDSWTVDCVLESSDSDDDRISVLGGFEYIPSDQPDKAGLIRPYDRVLYFGFGVSCGGLLPTNRWGIYSVYDTLDPAPRTTPELQTGTVFEHTDLQYLPSHRTSWSGATIRVRVERRQNIITAWCSDFGVAGQLLITDHKLLPKTEIKLNIKTGQIFNLEAGTWQTVGPNFVDVFSRFGPSSQYGVETTSQAMARYYDLHVWEDDVKYNTILDDTSTNSLTADAPLSVRYNDLSGTLYMRNIYSTQIDPISSALSGVFLKYQDQPDMFKQLNHGVLDFDIIGDVLFIKTKDYLFVEKYKFNYTTEQFTTILSKRVNLSIYADTKQTIPPVNYGGGGGY